MAFFLPLTRAWELLLGSLLAADAIPRLKPKLIRDWQSAIGLVMIIATMILINADTQFPGWATLPPCIGTILILQAGDGRESWAGRLLSWMPLVWIGSISYSLYLWHWPIIAYLRWVTLGSPTPTQLSLALLLSVVVGWLSLRFIERPVLNHKLSGLPVIAVGVASIVISAATAASLWTYEGLPQRFPTEALALQRLAAVDSNPRRDQCHGENNLVRSYKSLCSYGNEESIDTIVWGDSYAAELPVVLAERGGGYLQASSSACPPALGYNPPKRSRCAVNNRRRLAEIQADTRIRRVILASNYAVYPEKDLGRMLMGLGHTAEALRTSGREVIILYPVPQPPMYAPDALAILYARRQDPTSFGITSSEFRKRTAELTAKLDDLVRRSGATALRPADRLCAGSRCAVIRAGVGPLYFDASHPGLRGWRYAI